MISTDAFSSTLFLIMQEYLKISDSNHAQQLNLYLTELVIITTKTFSIGYIDPSMPKLLEGKLINSLFETKTIFK